MILDGYGASLKVVGGCLVASHGYPDREEVKLARVQREVRHIVIRSRKGYVSLDALEWCSATGITVTVLDALGRPLMVTAAPTSVNQATWGHAALHRAQATTDGLEIARYLIHQKLLRQAGNIGSKGPYMGKWIERVEGASTLREILSMEAVGARWYWRHMQTTPVHFSASVPEHWTTWGMRKPNYRQDGVDPHNHYKAITPGMAAINYLYGYLASEVVTVCYSVGLNPLLGVIHKDVKQPRPGLAHDLMEPCRPLVDSLVSKWCESRLLLPREAVETSTGAVVLKPAVRRELVQMAGPTLRSPILAHAKKVNILLRQP